MASPELQHDDAKQEKKRNILVVVIVLLVLLNGYFAFNHYRTKKKADHFEAKRNEIDSLYSLAIYEIEQAKEKLNLLKGKNQKLDKVLLEREKQLEEKQKQIEALLQKNELTIVELVNARKLVNILRDGSGKYLSEIATLNKSISILTKEKDSLNNTIQNTIAENEILAEEKKKLNNKITQGSLLKPENINGIGTRNRSNGNETETNVAKKAEKIKICFDVPYNRIAEPEEKEIFVKIISPSGSTIAVESQGSGTLIDAETLEPIQYTTTAKFNYNNTKENICVYWKQNTTYSKGKYKVKLYQNNYFLSEGEFELK
jgi:regulator of replication initiation timing